MDSYTSHNWSTARQVESWVGSTYSTILETLFLWIHYTVVSCSVNGDLKHSTPWFIMTVIIKNNYFRGHDSNKLLKIGLLKSKFS